MHKLKKELPALKKGPRKPCRKRRNIFVRGFEWVRSYKYNVKWHEEFLFRTNFRISNRIRKFEGVRKAGVENKSETGWSILANHLANMCCTEAIIERMGLRSTLSLCTLSKLYNCERWEPTGLMRLYTLLEIRLLLYAENNCLCILAYFFLLLLVFSHTFTKPIFLNLKESCKLTSILSI